jgi:hypothetical protein
MNRTEQLELWSEIRRNSGYLARQEIEKLKDICRADPKRLEQYGFKVYSQSDEDGILDEIFKRLNIEKGVFCEIGVENGLECNTFLLLHKGWKGVWLEGNANQQGPIQIKFSPLIKKQRLGVVIGYVTPDNINQDIQRVCKHINAQLDDVDFISIDIDGMDIYLLEALDFQPKVVCIEYNAKFPPPLSKKPVFNSNYVWSNVSDYMGSSLTALTEVAGLKGYSLVATNIVGSNAFFVRNDLLGDHFVNDPTPELLYNPPRYYLVYDHYQNSVGHPADFGPYTDLD